MAETAIVRAGTELFVPAAKKLITAADVVLKGAIIESGPMLDHLAASGRGRVSKLLPANPISLPEKVMITYIPAGNGHKSAAQAVASVLEQEHGIKADIVDIAPLSKSAQMGTDAFNHMVKTNQQIAGKSLWGWIYDIMDRKPPSEYETVGGKAWSYMTMGPKSLVDGLRLRVQSATSPQFYEMMRDVKPDLVLNAHQLGADLIGFGTKQGKLQPGIHNMAIVTDFFGHSIYNAPGLEATFVPAAEVGDQLVRRGVDPDIIHNTGIPVNPVFAKRPTDLAGVRQKLGLTPGARTVLVQGNLVNDLGTYKNLIDGLKAKFPHGTGQGPLEIAIVAGKDAAMKEALEGWLKSRPTDLHLRVKVFGFVDPPTMRDLMAVSQVGVGKPGGLTSSESLAMGLPQLHVDVMKGGQETRNAEFMGKRGASVSVGSFDAVTDALADLLDKPRKLEAMRAAAEKLGRPNAAHDIARQVVAAVRQPK